MQEQLEIVVDSASFSLTRPTMPQTAYTECGFAAGMMPGRKPARHSWLSGISSQVRRGGALAY